MKKIFLILLVLVMASPLIAQKEKKDKKHEISVGLGISGSEMPDRILKDIISGMSGAENNFSTDDKKRSGFYLSYKYHFNKRWSAGTTLTYKHLTKEKSVNTTETKYRQNFYGINLECQYTYLNKRMFRMYALGGIGVYTCRESLRIVEKADQNRTSDHTADFTYQISPLCFEIGTNIGFKMEYGYGYKGIGSAGVYVRF